MAEGLQAAFVFEKKDAKTLHQVLVDTLASMLAMFTGWTASDRASAIQLAASSKMLARSFLQNGSSVGKVKCAYFLIANVCAPVMPLLKPTWPWRQPSQPLPLR